MLAYARSSIQFQIHSRRIHNSTAKNLRFEFPQAANRCPMARIACIMVADFSIAALVRSNPALADKVLAIGKSLAPHPELHALSMRARELRIPPRLTTPPHPSISPAPTDPPP